MPASPGAIFIAGPTASGKSALTLALCEQLGGEIISVDSMQVYRGLDIGTAKPTLTERERVRHHLLDVVELHESFDAARFCELARAAATEIRERGKLPVFCGGTGLYFKAYLEGLGEAPPSDAGLRKSLEEMPLEELLAELQSKDPVTFERIDRQNPRRVVRALEVIRLTGRPFSEQRSAWETRERSQVPHFYGLERDANDLKERIDQRVDEMFKAGLVAETEHLRRNGLEENKTAMQAIGYRQVVEHLRGERTLPETIELIKTKTRQYAKRQGTWFRGQFDLQWLHVEKSGDPAAIAETICRRIRSSASAAPTQ